MSPQGPSLEARLLDRGVTRREFLKFCSLIATTLALPATFTPKIAKAMNSAARLPVVWLEFQDCAGNTESFLRASAPTVADIVLEQISLDYHETLMAPSGPYSERSLHDTMERHKGNYIAIIEGSIPAAHGGIYCTIGGRTALDIAREVCGNAMATFAVGACAWDGGWPAASPNPTGAMGVREAVPGIRNLINFPGCPVNVVNLTAAIVHYLTFNELPAVDTQGRPFFAYGQLIHNNCERRGHFDAGRYVENWGDDGHRQGWCLYKMGCKGPQTYSNCPSVQWNDGTNWPIGVGHGCVGCMSERFWDATVPFYERIPHVEGFGVEMTADQVGTIAIGGVVAAAATHAAASAIRAKQSPLADHAIEEQVIATQHASKDDAKQTGRRQ